MKSIKLKAYIKDKESEYYKHPIGFKLLKPNGIILFYNGGTLTLPLEDVTLEVENDQNHSTWKTCSCCENDAEKQIP